MARRGAIKYEPEANGVTIPPQDSNEEPKPGLGADHPLNDIIGTYEGPTWERILKNIERNRKSADQDSLEERE